MINILNLIYPEVCGMCGRLSYESICNKCYINIKKYETNLELSGKNKYFDEGMYIYEYKDNIRNKIIEYKFQDQSYLYKTFGRIVLKNKKICGILEKYDIIIPVPIHKKRKQKRGYNQAELIARYISKNLNIDCENNVLVKTKNVISQTKLNKKDRINSVKNVFNIKNEEKINNKNIVLFDDIYTTGSTLNECSKILKNAGAKKVFALTIAKD